MNNDIKYNIKCPGKILRHNVNHYVDQLSDNDELIFTRQLNNYLLNKYNLTIREYYNLVVYGNKDHKIICNKCGNELKFVNLLYGYSNKCNICKSINLINNSNNNCSCCGRELNEKNHSANCRLCDDCNGKNFQDNSNFIELNGNKIYHYGIIAKVTHDTYLDQFNNTTKVRYLSRFIEYINTNYNLSQKDYYNLVVKGDLSYSHTCENKGCNNTTDFINLNLGYKRFCCKGCGYSSRGDLSGNFKSYYDKLNKSVAIINNKRKKIFKLMSKEEIIMLMYHGYRCYSGKYSSKYPKAYLYYAEFNDNSEIFKIGISVNTSDRWYKAGYKNPRVLHEGSVEEISKLEYTIKKTFIDNLVLESEYPTETFKLSDYDLIINFINSIIH